MKPLLFLAMMTAACSWSKFDDLSDQTPVRATETPDGVSATSYGVSIVGATLPGETSGGKIAVLSSGPGNYSTLDLDPDGSSIDLGDNEKLGNHTIDSVTTKGVVLFDGVGQVALVDNSNVGTVVAVLGAPDALANDQQIPTALPPDTATFVGGLVWVGVTPTTASPANIAGNDGQNKFACQALDGALPTPMAVQPAAIALSADKAVLWVYAKTGGLFSYHVSDLEACGNAPTPVQVAPASATFKTTDTMAALPAAPNAGHLDLVVEGASTYAILTAYDSTSSATGFVDVFDITNAAAPTATAASVVAAPGVRAAAYDTFDGTGILALGYPSRAIESTSAAGAVDLHEFTGGVLGTTAGATLTIPNSDSNHLFGRAVTTTRYNGKPIVVVAADNTVYSFYETSLYAKR